MDYKYAKENYNKLRAEAMAQGKKFSLFDFKERKMVDRKEYLKAYYRDHCDKLIARSAEWTKKNLKRVYENRKKYYEKYPWLKFKNNAKARCNNKNCSDYKYYGAKGIRYEITDEELRLLWIKCNASEIKNPSLRRIELLKNYTYENCRFK